MIPQIEQRRDQVGAQRGSPRGAPPAPQPPRPRRRAAAGAGPSARGRCARRSSCRRRGSASAGRRRRACTARTRSAGSIPESTASARRGPMPLIAISRSNSCCSSAVTKPKSESASSRTCVWMRSDDLAPASRQLVERGERHLHVVADAAARRRPAASACFSMQACRGRHGNHPSRSVVAGHCRRGASVARRRARRRSAPARRRRPARRADGRGPGVHVADRHRERVGRVVRRRHVGKPEQQPHHLLDLVLLGAPVADHRALDLGGRVLGDLVAGLHGRQHRHAARVPELQRAAHVDGVEEALDGDALRPALGQERGQALVNRQELRGKAVATGSVTIAPQTTSR